MESVKLFIYFMNNFLYYHTHDIRLLNDYIINCHYDDSNINIIIILSNVSWFINYYTVIHSTDTYMIVL